MDNIINSIRSLFSTYGFRATAVIVATIIIVNLIKKPIVAKAKQIQAQSGMDKAVITKNITALPVIVAFALEMLIEITINKFNFAVIDFSALVANAVLYGALAVATYEGVKKQLEAYSAKKNEENSSIAPTVTASKPVSTKNAETPSPATLVSSATIPANLDTTEKSTIVFNTND